MSILVGLHHVTRYTYDRPIALGPQVVRLRPAPHCRTRIPSYSLKVTPAQHFVNWQQDPHGNWLARFVFPEKTTEFSVEVDLLADMEVINPFDFFVEPYAEKWPFAFPAELREDLAAYLEPEPAGPRLQALLASISREPRNTVDFLVELNQRLQRDDRLRRPHGAGRADARRRRWRAAPARAAIQAWLLVQILRHLGLAGALRLRLSDPAEARREGARRPGRHRPRTSPTCTPGPRSICPAPAGSASTRPPACCAARAICRWPRRRITAPPRRSPAWSSRAKSTFAFEMKVTRVAEQPRVTKPFSDEAWAALDALGEKVDADLARARRAPDHGRRADLRLDRRLSRRRNGTPPRSARPSAASPTS